MSVCVTTYCRGWTTRCFVITFSGPGSFVRHWLALRTSHCDNLVRGELDLMMAFICVWSIILPCSHYILHTAKSLSYKVPTYVIWIWQIWPLPTMSLSLYLNLIPIPAPLWLCNFAVILDSCEDVSLKSLDCWKMTKNDKMTFIHVYALLQQRVVGDSLNCLDAFSCLVYNFLNLIIPEISIRLLLAGLLYYFSPIRSTFDIIWGHQPGSGYSILATGPPIYQISSFVPYTLRILSFIVAYNK